MFRWTKSIRIRLTFWYSFILLVTLVTCGLIAYLYLSDQLNKNLDHSLTDELVWMRSNPKLWTHAAADSTQSKQSKKQAGLQVHVVPPPPRLSDEEGDSAIAVWNRIYSHLVLNPKKTIIGTWDGRGALVYPLGGKSGELIPYSLLIGRFPENEVSMFTVEWPDGVPVRVATTSTSNRLEMYVAYPLEELESALENLFRIFRFLIPIAVLISLGVGWVLAYQSLKPVDEITRTANEITAQNLDRRIPGRGVDDEIGRLTSTINGMIGRLSDAFEQIKQFSIDASHELRTPLTIIRGEVELALRSTKSPEEYRQVLVSTLEEVVRLAAIVDDLLTLSKADLNQHVMAYEQIQLNDLVAELYEDSTIIAEKKHITVGLQRNEDLIILGDKIRLRQLFLNLVDNAIKYTPERGVITLASRGQNGFARVEVRDTGIGISPDDQRNIFNRFYRADRARSREVAGSGLGLSISKWIAELHGGRIEVASEPGKGSCFAVYLPL